MSSQSMMSPPQTDTSPLPSNSKTSTPAVQRTQKTRECAVCHEEVSESQFTKFSTCPTNPCNKTCKFCWTKHVKIQVIDNPLLTVSCFDCGHALTQSLVKQRLNNHDRAHYEWKLARLQGTHRVCTRVHPGDDRATRACHGIMKAPPTEPSSSTVICSTCNAQDCLTCNSPIHPNETCSAHQIRITTSHGADEAKTAAAFANGYTAEEEVGKLGNRDDKAKRPVQCPGCGIYCERKEKCPRIRCLCCNMEFCSRQDCVAPYLGKGSVPELDNKAHASSCAHSKRTRPDKRFQKPSKGKTSDVEVESKKKRKAGEKSEDADDDDDDGDGDDGDEVEQPAKKRKRQPVSNELVKDSDNEDEAELCQVPAKPKRKYVRRTNVPLSEAEQEEHNAKQAELAVRRHERIVRKMRRQGLENKKRNLEENTEVAMMEWEKLYGPS